MSDKYQVSPDIRMLIQRNNSGDFHQLEERILRRELIPKIIVWNDIVLDDIYVFDLCVENHIDFRPYGMEFPSEFHVYSWICSEQLERSDITNTMRRFLLGYLALAESAIYLDVKNGEILKIPAKKESVDIVAKCYGLSSVSVFNHKRMVVGLLKINKISPELARSILDEKVRITSQQIISLSERKDDAIRKFAYELSNWTSNDFPKYSELNKRITNGKQIDRRKRRIMQEIVPEIRKMPEYDPDAELMSLSLTLPSWINSIRKLCNMDVKESSIRAKNDLYEALNRLSDTAELLKNHLEDSISEQ